jgi:hypothetical protein
MEKSGNKWRRNSAGALRAPGAFGARGTSAPHAIFSSCPLHVTRVCSLAAVLRPSAAAATGSAAGAFGARWHLHWHAIVSSRAVQARASARSQALDATCVSRKRHQVHGDASFCAEREILINIVGIPDKGTVQSRRANAQEAKSTSTDTLIEFRAAALLFFFKKRPKKGGGGFQDRTSPKDTAS